MQEKAVSPEKIIENLREQENQAIEILPELKSMYHETKEKEESFIYKGKKGIKNILQDILKYKGYIAFGSQGKFLNIMKHDFINFQKRKKELNIKSRVILGEKAKNSESVKIAHSNFKFIPEQYSSPTTTFVFDENIAIIVWTEVPVAMVIKSRDVADSYKNYFELLWKIAKG